MKDGRLGYVYATACVRLLLMLLEEPKMDVGLKRCRPLFTTVGHTAKVCVCVCVCVCVVVQILNFQT